MKVSIITPSFNQGRFIERTLQSVANQSGAEIEHVVFDGGSSDCTLEILKKFSPPVRWVSRKDNGQTDAVNQGILATDGEIIGWLNSDDIYYPDTIKRVVAFFEAHPEVDLVYGMAEHIDVEDRAYESYYTEQWDFKRLTEICFICQPALFFRRKVVEKYGLLDESLNYCMDYEFWLRVGKGGARFAYLQEKLAGSRMYAENKSLGERSKVCEEINGMLKKMFGKVPDDWLMAYAQQIAKQRSESDGNAMLLNIRIAISLIVASIRWNRCVSTLLMRMLYNRFIRLLDGVK